MNTTITTSRPMGIVPMTTSESALGIINTKLVEGGYIVDKHIPPREVEITRRIAQREIDRIMGLSRQGEMFDDERERIFKELRDRDKMKPDILRKQLLQIIDALIVDKDRTINDRTEKLTKALQKAELPYSDTDIQSYIREGKETLGNIRKLINPASKVGYHQARDAYWDEYETHFRGIFRRRKIYDMVLDLSEIMYKWYLPRVVVPGTKYKKHRKY